MVSVTLRAGVAGWIVLRHCDGHRSHRPQYHSVGRTHLGWFAVSNILIELVARGFRRWELFTNAIAFISEGDVPRYEKIHNYWELLYAHDYLSGGLIVALWAAAFAGIAALVFVRRDIA